MWQPIETAPEETPILVTNGKMVIATELWRFKDFPLSTLDFGVVGFDCHDLEWDFEYSDATHWMPLPKPPKE